MGLDTVELVVEFEKYFQVDITDPAAEQMGTVGDVATWVGQQLKTTGQRHSAVRVAVLQLLRQQLLPGASEEEAEVKLLRDLLPDRRAYERAAQQLLSKHGVRLPIPDLAPKFPRNGWLVKLFGGTPPPPVLPVYRFAQLVDRTVALNYEKLLGLPFANQYDVEQAVIGLTADKTGMDVPEVKLGSKFTDDLGLD